MGTTTLSLLKPVTQEDIFKHWQKNLMAELAMPFTPKSHEYCLYLLDCCDPEKAKELFQKISARFYSEREDHGKIPESTRSSGTSEKRKQNAI